MWALIGEFFYVFVAGICFEGLMLGWALEKKLGTGGLGCKPCAVLRGLLLAAIWPISMPWTALRRVKRMRRYQEFEASKLLLSELEKKINEKRSGQ